MKPVFTCLWQAQGRNVIDFEEWMKLDLQYIDTWSLLLDFKICLRTIPIVLLGKGRYPLSRRDRIDIQSSVQPTEAELQFKKTRWENIARQERVPYRHSV